MLLSLPTNKKTVIKVVENVCPKQENYLETLQAEKQVFLKYGIVPRHNDVDDNATKNIKKHKQVAVSFEFLPEAKRILDLVNSRFGHGDTYLDEVFGERISQSEATKYLVEYLKSQGLEGALQILWSKDITCCGRIMWAGPSVRFNRPERMRYSLWVKSTDENVYLRKDAIKGLADHEIGTHYLRMRNDGFQPWFSNRKIFGLRSLHSNYLKTTEEGFAALNTLLQLKCRLLWRPAFLYYYTEGIKPRYKKITSNLIDTACMAVKMTFKELYDHLETYIWDNDQRWKHVMRVKRHLEDYNGYGGTGQDQAYFAGAVRILRNADNIDFKLLYSGKLCFDELDRVKRISRGSVKLPHFLNDVELYRHALREMVYVNCLEPVVIARPLPRTKMKGKIKVSKMKTRSKITTVEILKFVSQDRRKISKGLGFPTNKRFAITSQ